jgi:ankyrin repeat protein
VLRLTPPRRPSAAALRRCERAQDGNTPLQWAAFKGDVACVKLLVERGANKEAKNTVRCDAHLQSLLLCAAPTLGRTTYANTERNPA